MLLTVLIHWLVVALFCITAGCLLFGLVLVFFPFSVMRAAGTLNRRYSTRRKLRPLEVPRASEPFLYRHHRIVGAFIILGALFFLVRFTFGPPQQRLLIAFRNILNPAIADWLVPGLAVILWGGNLLALITGVLVMVRPSILKQMESWTNRWVSTRRAFRFADTPLDLPDRVFGKHPRLIGLLIIAGSAFVLLNLASIL